MPNPPGIRIFVLNLAAAAWATMAMLGIVHSFWPAIPALSLLQSLAVSVLWRVIGSRPASTVYVSWQIAKELVAAKKISKVS